MRTLKYFFFAVVVGSMSVGCTPSPEKVCGKTMELLEKEFGDKKKKSDDDDKDKEKEQKEKFLKECVKKADKEKTDDPDAYKCGAKCVMDAKDLEDAAKCEKSCPKKDKKKGGDDDDDKDTKKKKKGGDDDDDDKGKKNKKSDD
jgi:hypothetical protein